MDYDYGALASISHYGASITTSIADYSGKPLIFLTDCDKPGYKRYYIDCLNDTRKLEGKRVVIID